MRTLLLCALLQLFMLYAYGQTTRQPLNFLQTGVSAYSQHHTDAFSFSANQASLASVSSFTAGVYGERRFLLEGLGWYQAVAALPTKSGNFALKGTYFGSTGNKETEIGLAYGRKLGDKLSIGAQFNYYNQQIAQYGSKGAISVEGGMLLKVNEHLQAGLHIYNPNNSRLGKAEEELPAAYTIGLGYEPSAQLAITAAVQKIEAEKMSIKAGMQYQFDKKLYAKAGLETAHSIYSMGVGVRLESISLEVLTSLHPQLGLTPGLLLIFHQKDK